MNNNINYITKNNTRESILDKYMSDLTVIFEKKISVSKKFSKIDDDNIIIPTVKNYDVLYKYNYNVSQLKMISKKYKLKITGNKNQLLTRIYSYLYFSSFIIKIQSVFRGLLARKYRLLHGPAAMDRILCTNKDDFITLEPIEEINFHRFLSYKDVDGFIYGFDIISLHNLFLKSKCNEAVPNPYNRNPIPETVIKNIKSILRMSKILKININMHNEDDTLNLSCEKTVELRALGLFQNIDALGNYSNSQWFLSLNRNQLIKFVRELCDIWNYRAQITLETKRNIYPPAGDIFRNLSMTYIHTEPNIHNVKKVILEVLEKLVNNGVDKDSKSLGAYYVLGSLTLVNETAAAALPWLFESFCYI